MLPFWPDAPRRGPTRPTRSSPPAPTPSADDSDAEIARSPHRPVEALCGGHDTPAHRTSAMPRGPLPASHAPPHARLPAACGAPRHAPSPCSSGSGGPRPWSADGWLAWPERPPSAPSCPSSPVSPGAPQRPGDAPRRGAPAARCRHGPARARLLAPADAFEIVRSLPHGPGAAV